MQPNEDELWWNLLGRCIASYLLGCHLDSARQIFPT